MARSGKSGNEDNVEVFQEREEELENALNKGALWAVTYGDMMSYLMIFFLVLFSLYFGRVSNAQSALTMEKSLVGIQKVFGGRIDPERLKRIENLSNEQALAFRLKESQEVNNLSQFVQIQSNEENIRLVLPESISFDSGQAELKDSAKPVLDTLAQLVKELPNNIVVEGHTDSVPVRSGKNGYQNNFYLSAMRAYSVMEYLIKTGIDPKKLSGQGYGENRPIAENSTQEGRAKNRRVEIVLVRSR